MKRVAVCLLAAMVLASLALPCGADPVELVIPAYDPKTGYFEALLVEALRAAGHDVVVRRLDPSVQQARAVKMMDEDAGISLIPIFKTPERDAKYVAIDVDILGRLMAWRILLIPTGQQAVYDEVKTLDDYRNLRLVSGFGKDWFDAVVWQENDLLYIEKDGSWNPTLYLMVAARNRGVDNFPRGAVEVPVELPLHDGLEAEKRLLFVYERPFIFYLARSAAPYRDIIRDALAAAVKSGLMDRMIRQFFPEVFDPTGLDLDGRVRIILETP